MDWARWWCLGGDGVVKVKLGVWISSTKTRRATLAPERLTGLAELGLSWAT
jgi:hypothetical protein